MFFGVGYNNVPVTERDHLDKYTEEDDTNGCIYHSWKKTQDVTENTFNNIQKWIAV